MSSDADLLWEHIEVWKATADDVKTLLRELDADEWELPTALPGWDVRAVASHLAHLESELAGNKQVEVEVPEAPHIVGLMGQFTERGPIARREWEHEEIISEFGQSVAARYEKLANNPPEDASALAPGFAGLIGWSWATLLSNRPVDLWMHDQDIRRATGRPGDLTTPGAAHTAGVLAASLPFVLGKRAQAPIGTTLVLEVTGAAPQTHAVRIGDNGRGVPIDPNEDVPAEPTVRITLDFVDWIALAGGRVERGAVEATIEGDDELGERVLSTMAVTP